MIVLGLVHNIPNGAAEGGERLSVSSDVSSGHGHSSQASSAGTSLSSDRDGIVWSQPLPQPHSSIADYRGYFEALPVSHRSASRSGSLRSLSPRASLPGTPRNSEIAPSTPLSPRGSGLGALHSPPRPAGSARPPLTAREDVSPQQASSRLHTGSRSFPFGRELNVRLRELANKTLGADDSLPYLTPEKGRTRTASAATLAEFQTRALQILNDPGPFAHHPVGSFEPFFDPDALFQRALPARMGPRPVAARGPVQRRLVARRLELSPARANGDTPRRVRQRFDVYAKPERFEEDAIMRPAPDGSEI